MAQLSVASPQKFYGPHQIVYFIDIAIILCSILASPNLGPHLSLDVIIPSERTHFLVMPIGSHNMVYSMVRISTRRLRACLPLLANTNFNRTTWRTNHGHACASSLASAYAHTLSRSVSITLISVHSSFPGDGADDGVDPHSQTRPQQSAHGRGASYLVKPSAGRITGNSPMLSCGSSRPQQVPRERVMARLPRISPFFQGSDVLNAPFCRDFAIFGACPACATLPCPVRGGGTRLAGALKALFFLGTAAHRPSAVSAPSRRRSFDMDPQVFQLVEWRLQDRPVWRSGQSGASGA